MSSPPFNADCRPILIGSLPLKSHREAMEMILSCTPEIPLWPQLPYYPAERMTRQFISGIPGLTEDDDNFYINTTGDDFTDKLTTFFQELIDGESQQTLPVHSPFNLSDETCKGFSVLKNTLQKAQKPFFTVKGQITGPLTTGIALKDEDGNSLFYNEMHREMITKLLAMRARWQAEQLRTLPLIHPPIIFIDEPGMVSFGSTSLTTVTREMVSQVVEEVIDGIIRGGGISGVHICANGDWEPALQSRAQIISFDAYSYFANFIIYRDQLTRFLAGGGLLAWGIVPTGNTEAIERESVDSLYDKWLEQCHSITDLGFSYSQICQQTLISPACGTGSLSLEHARRVLELTATLSKRIRDSI